MMRTIAIALGSFATVFAATALAQDNQERSYPYDPERVERQQEREARGDYRRNDARDMRRYDDPYTNELRQQYYRGAPGVECWNWRARTFERVREGEYQDDLDYNRCRAYDDGAYRNYRWRY